MGISTFGIAIQLKKIDREKGNQQNQTVIIWEFKVNSANKM